MHQTTTETAHQYRASALGAVATIALAALGVAVLSSTWHNTVLTMTVAVPVDRALLTLAALGVGVGSIVLAWICALGSIAAHSGVHAAAAPGRPHVVTGRWGAKAGAVLLALTLTAPGAQASRANPLSASHVGSAVETIDHLGAGYTRGSQSEGEDRPDGVPLPGWTPTATQAAQGQTQHRPTRTPASAATTSAQRSHVVITRGDTLWGVTASHLGREATSRQIAGHWPQWYAENRETIGADPDVLQPGQVLHPPRHSSPASPRPPGVSR